MSLESQNNHFKTINYQWKITKVYIDYFKEKVVHSTLWPNIGDAAWVPTEMMTYQKIQSTFWKVTTYLDANNSVLIQRAVRLSKWKVELPADWIKWIISDDSEFQSAWMESFIDSADIDLDNLMIYLIKTYENYPYWFWRSTEQAFERYKQREKDTPNKLNYIDLWWPKQAWNGVLMKQAPYASIFLAGWYSDEEIEKTMVNICKITHGSPTAIIASLVHNKLLMELLKVWENLETNIWELFSYLQMYSETLEKKYLQEWDDKISLLLEKLLEDYKAWWLGSYEEVLEKYWWWEKIIYSSGYIITTLWIVYSLFLKRQNFESLIDCVNIGWDTDTYGAIIGWMLGAYKSKFYEDRFIDWLHEKDYLVDISNRFSEKLTSHL